jgi:hypothetical protein
MTPRCVLPPRAKGFGSFPLSTPELPGAPTEKRLAAREPLLVSPGEPTEGASALPWTHRHSRLERLVGGAGSFVAKPPLISWSSVAAPSAVTLAWSAGSNFSCDLAAESRQPI